MRAHFPPQRPKKRRKISNGAILVLCTVVLCGCGVPKDSTVTADFLREHPDYAVQGIGVGEGDSGAAYFHIRYRRPGDDAVHETIWQYLKGEDGRWKLNHKDISK